MNRIFVSFRKIDDRATRERVYIRLRDEFGPQHVFKSGESIPPGTDHGRMLENQARECPVMVVLIGQQWLGVRDAHGTRLIDRDEDWVRFEIRTALAAGNRVIPVLLGEGTRLPTVGEVPPDLAALANLQSRSVAHSAVEAGLDELVEDLYEALPQLAASRPGVTSGDDGTVNDVDSFEREKPYPVIEERRLPVVKPTRLFGRHRRDLGELPPRTAGTALVFLADGRFIVYDELKGLTGQEDFMLGALTVAVVDLRPHVFHADIELPSAHPSFVFVIRTTFSAVVRDASEVVQMGVVDLPASLSRHLRQDPKLAAICASHEIERIADIRVAIDDRVQSYFGYRPYQNPGIAVSLELVEVIAPQELRERDRRLREETTDSEIEMKVRELEILKQQQTITGERELNTLGSSLAYVRSQHEATRQDQEDRNAQQRRAAIEDLELQLRTKHPDLLIQHLYRDMHDLERLERMLDVARNHDRDDRSASELRKLLDALVGEMSRAQVAAREVHTPTDQGGPSIPLDGPSRTNHDGPDRLLVAECPAQAERGRAISLIVRITAGDARHIQGVRASMPDLVIDGRGALVTIVVLAPSGLVSEGPLEQVIDVKPRSDPAPIRFSLLARDEGLQRLRVTAWAGGSFLCELTVEVSVTARAALTTSPHRQVAELGEIRAAAGEVTLQITRHSGRYAFQLFSDAYMGRTVFAEALAGSPDQVVEDTISTLRAMAIGKSEYTPGNTYRAMRAHGIGLWNALVPELVRDKFWQLREDIRTFSIAADDSIPWELLYPSAPGMDEGFLVHQFPVLRRALDQGRAKHLEVSDPRFVVSAREPQNAQSELACLRRLVGAGSLVRELEELLNTVEAGNLGLAHFACHNSFNTQGGSTIDMQGGPFTPSLLNAAVAQRSLARRSPLVFMNACRSASARPEYTRMTGWAQQFMAAGAGAFVGTLWAVRSESAAIFAEAFYERLVAGECLGDAVLTARRSVRGTDTDPTWLAYCVYGDPAATIAPGYVLE